MMRAFLEAQQASLIEEDAEEFELVQVRARGRG